jgi:hypothetical protein
MLCVDNDKGGTGMGRRIVLKGKEIPALCEE